MPQSSSIHVPVLAAEVLEWLQPEPGQVFVDGTLGGGGHTRLIAQCVGSQGLVIALDRDPAAFQRGAETLCGLPIQLVQSSYSELPQVLEQLEVDAVDGVLLDLGISSDQLQDEARGFSFEAAGALDLRFDPEAGEPAWRLLDRLDVRRLADLIYEFGEERFSRRIARQIVDRRRSDPIRTAKQLADLVRRCVPHSRTQRIDPATRTFQALRIAVNAELAELQTALEQLPACLSAKGRVVVISFHSLEDRIVKTAFRDDSRYLALTKKPIRPNELELGRNPRSRSARLRAAQLAPPAGG